MGKAIRVIGYILLAIGGLFIITGYLLIVMHQGWGKLQEVLSPLNPWNLIANLITLAPGAALIWLGNRLDERKRRATSLPPS